MAGPARRGDSRQIKTRPDPVGKAIGPAPDVSYAAAGAADRRRRGGGPRAGGKGMRNMSGQPWDLAVRRSNDVY